MPLKVYDKVSWHFPDGKNCPDIQSATLHFRTLLKWLQERSLLSPFGKAVAAQEIGEDFSITSEMLSAQGAALLDEYYDAWLQIIDYSSAPSTDYWEGKLPHGK